MSPSAPSVTLDQVNAAIVNETYTILPDERTTVCQLTLYNDFTVEGHSACVNKENFDFALGQKYSRERAVEKVWAFLGFRLAEDQYRQRFNSPELGTTSAPSPELGEQVLFYEVAACRVSPPMVAFITGLKKGSVSLAIFAPNGTAHARESVVLVGPDDHAPNDVPYFARRK